MKKIIILVFVCLFVQAIWCTNVFILDKEIPTFHFHDPETGNLVQGDYSIEYYLEELGITCEYGQNLPLDISMYDAVFVLCGSWCVG